jgi:imidazolonepropionase-like amidohydrolase
MKNCLIRFLVSALLPFSIHAQVAALRVGHLVNPENGTVQDNVVIVVQDGNFSAIGANATIPAGAEVIDLSQYWVSPGLVDAHNHLALTQKLVPEGDQYYLTTVLDSTVIRGIQAVSNGFSMLASGFTMERDLGNNANYADTALRMAIEQGWVPGPTIINSGLIIGGFGGQFNPVPEREMLIYPEYLNADTKDEIIRAVHRNIGFGARVIKICVDCKSFGYTVDEIKLFITEAARAGMKVAGHSGTRAGVMRAIEAGIWSVEHCGGCDDETHRLMAQKGIWRVGTEFPLIDYDTMTVFDRINPRSERAQARYKRQEDSLRSAYANHVKMGFSSDADYYIPGKTRGQVVIDFLKSWTDAGIPASEILKIMTVNGYQICDMYDRRGPIKTGLPADLIAVRSNPLQDINTLKDVRFVMKDGMVFKRDGVVLAEKFFHGGPVYGGRGGRGGRGGGRGAN